MFTYPSLALRNVGRNKARSALTVGAIFFSVMVTTLLSSLVGGMRHMMMDDLIKGRTGALQIHRKGYFDVRENQPLELDMEQGGELQRRIEAVPGVAAVAPRIAFAGMVNNGSSATIFLGQAISPEEERRVVPLATRTVAGTPVGSEAPNGGVVGAGLAEALGVEVGGTLVLQATTQESRENALDLDVGGLDHDSSPLESKRMIFVPLAYAQELLGMEGRVTEYAVAVTDRDRIDEVAARVRQALGDGFEVHTWDELRPGLLDLLDLQRAILGFIAAVFLAISVIGVVNTMVMSVMERTREIGTMMAVGVRREQIRTLFLLEAAAQAVIGAALGIVGGVGIAAAIIARGGIPIAEPGTTIPLRLVPVISPVFVVAVVLAATLGAMAAALWPALRAARLRPVDALRAV